MLDMIPFTSVITNLERGLAILTESFKSAQICLTQPLLLKSKAEVRTKLCDSLLYHVHLNEVKLVLTGLSWFQLTRTVGVECTKCLVEISIIVQTAKFRSTVILPATSKMLT